MLIIQGNGSSGPDATIIDQMFADRVFQVAEGVTVTFEDLEITGGTAIDNGAWGQWRRRGRRHPQLRHGHAAIILVITNNLARAGTTDFALGWHLFHRLAHD